MTYSAKKTSIIVCEGNSENAYIQELNRFFDANDYDISFVSKPIRNGHYKPATLKYKEVKRNNTRSNIYIWVDKDTYQRNDENDGYNYEHKPQKIPNFLFSYLNFEDFLVMHLDEEIVQILQEICMNNNHFNYPMHAEKYLKLLREYIFPNYKKGEIPFEITQNKFDNLLKNQQNPKIKFKCDIAEMIQQITS